MSDRVYRLLLWLLPGWFREEFGDEMRLVFADSRTRVTGAASIALWVATVRDMAALAWRLHVDALKQDVSYASRTLRAAPAFSLAAMATLAIGLGPTVVIANFVYQVVVAPLPFHDPERLVRIWNARAERRQTQVSLSVPDFIDVRQRQSAFGAFAAHAGTSVAMTFNGSARQIAGLLTTADLHHVLGVHPSLGRGLAERDSAPGAPPVMLLGARFWHTEFGARPDIVGQTIQVDGRATTIVGVLPEMFEFPSGANSYWLPLILDAANTARGTHFLNATGRLKPNVSLKQAEDDLNVIARGLAAEYPDTNAGKAMQVFGLKEQLNGEAPQLLGVLSGAIAAVLLIACLNVASLLTVRMSVRRSELAVRTALGATGRRLRRQLMVEHVILAVAGGVIGAVIAYGIHTLIIARRLVPLPATAAQFGWQGLTLLAFLIMVIGGLFAWVAARRSAAGAPAATLLRMARPTSSRTLVRARQTLVIAEVAAALVLLVTAGLMIRSTARLAAVDPGFRTDGVLTFGVVLPPQTYPEPVDRIRFAERVAHQLRAVPGVQDVAVGAYAPMGEMRANRRFAAADRPLPAAGQEPVALDLPVGARYFEVMDIRLLEGRTFSERDTADSPPVLIVSEQFAKATFPNERAIGQRIRFYSGRPGATPPPTREIVGVVRDVRQDGVASAPIVQMYTPYPQTPWGFLSFFLRVEGDAATYTATVQRVVNSVDPLRPARDMLTTAAIVRGSTDRRRAITWMLLALAALAIMLASVGLYGVSATAANARSRELAIRAAIGANPNALLRLVVTGGLVTSAVGVVIGAAASLVITKGLSTFLYEVSPRDPITIMATAVLLLLVAGIATYVPARRALATNPAEVLRAD